MLDLRQLNKTDSTQVNSDAQHFSRFSVEFQVPSDLLGNIGEPLDHYQSERLHEDELDNHEAAAEEQPIDARDTESAGPVAGPSGTRWEDEERVPLETSGLVFGPSWTLRNDSNRMSLGSAGPQ